MLLLLWSLLLLVAVDAEQCTTRQASWYQTFDGPCGDTGDKSAKILLYDGRYFYGSSACVSYAYQIWSSLPSCEYGAKNLKDTIYDQYGTNTIVPTSPPPTTTSPPPPTTTPPPPVTTTSAPSPAPTPSNSPASSSSLPPSTTSPTTASSHGTSTTPTTSTSKVPATSSTTTKPTDADTVSTEPTSKYQTETSALSPGSSKSKGNDPKTEGEAPATAITDSATLRPPPTPAPQKKRQDTHTAPGLIIFGTILAGVIIIGIAIRVRSKQAERRRFEDAFSQDWSPMSSPRPQMVYITPNEVLL